MGGPWGGVLQVGTRSVSSPLLSKRRPAPVISLRVGALIQIDGYDKYCGRGNLIQDGRSCYEALYDSTQAGAAQGNLGRMNRSFIAPLPTPGNPLLQYVEGLCFSFLCWRLYQLAL